MAKQIIYKFARLPGYNSSEKRRGGRYCQGDDVRVKLSELRPVGFSVETAKIRLDLRHLRVPLMWSPTGSETNRDQGLFELCSFYLSAEQAKN